MPAFKEMDPETIRSALEGHEDALSPLVRKEEAFFKNVSCTTCGEKNLTAVLNAARPFTDGVPLPNKLLKCLKCETEFDPYSGLITRFTGGSD